MRPSERSKSCLRDLLSSFARVLKSKKQIGLLSTYELWELTRSIHNNPVLAIRRQNTGKYLHLIFPLYSAIFAAYTTTQDTFYIDPDVHDHDSLAARAMQLGLKMKGFLEEGVTVWVTTGLAREKKAEGAAAEALRGRRTSRIHRMVRSESGLSISFLDLRVSCPANATHGF